MSDVKQLTDPNRFELRLPPETEEWADQILADYDPSWEVERTDEALILRATFMGNMNAVANAYSFMQDVDDALREGNVDPMAFTLVVT